MKTDNTDKMEEILSKRYVIDKGFSGSDEYIYNSMQDHTDQAIAEYKRKLKLDIHNLQILDDIFEGAIFAIIDTTTI